MVLSNEISDRSILYQNASQKFTTSWTVFAGRWTHLKKWETRVGKKTK